MKRINFKKISILLILPFLLFSCEKWIDPDINVDPNNPAEVSVDLLLPTVQVEIAYQLGGDVTRPNCMWVQHLSGVSRQSLSYERFTYRDSDVNNLWYYALYPSALMNCHIIIQKAAEEGSPHYAGVAKVLMAYTLGIMTDVWGDLPYSEAFQGADQLKPAFDSQAQIYAAIHTLLDEAMADLQVEEEGSVMSPGSDDLMYGGDRDLWLKAAYSIKARYSLHLSKKNGNAAYTDALEYLANGFTDNSENLVFHFGSNNLEENPTYQFDRDRGDIRIGAKIVDMMAANNDPRMAHYFAPDDEGGFSGSPPGGAILSASAVGPYYASANSPVPFMTYVELLYIKAEALLETGDNAGAIEAYNQALEASLNKFGVFDQAWYDANKFTGATIDLETIMWGKYVSLFLQPEVYVDMRRTNMMNTDYFTLPDDASLSTFPRRWPYASSEKAYNGANVPGVSLTDRLWWDE